MAAFVDKYFALIELYSCQKVCKSVLSTNQVDIPGSADSTLKTQAQMQNLLSFFSHEHAMLL